MADDLEKFAQCVAGILRPEWQRIPSPDSEQWSRAFEDAVDEYLASKGAACDYTKFHDEPANELPSVDLSAVDPDERFNVAYKIMGIMEGLWLQGKRKIDAIDLCEKNHPLSLDDVVTYALRLRGTTYSPPENANVHDPTRHYEMFPQHHFLGTPDVAQMHASRLFALSRLAQQSSLPKVIFEPVSEDMQRMRLECSTPGAVIHYQTSRVNNEQVNPQTGQPTVYTTAPAVYDATKKFNFKTTCNAFVVMAWSTCEGLRNSDVARVEYQPPTSTKDAEVATAKRNFGLFLGREKKK